MERYKTLTEQLTKYAGIPLYIICLYGTVMNIIIFSQRIYRHRSGSLYLLVASICDALHLNVGPLTNILQYAFHFDWPIHTLLFCQTKSYLLFVIMSISATLTCLATITQYILSSKKHRRWKYTSRKIAIRCIVIISISWAIIFLPIAGCYTRYFHPSRKTFCFVIEIFSVCLINGFLHPFVMLVFSLRIYRNIQQIHQRSLMKSTQIRQVNYQVSSMLVLQSIKSSFASLPYAFFNSYLLITMKTDKSLFRQAKETLIGQLLYFIFCSNYTSFFLYIYSSTIFKEQWKKLFSCRAAK